jgi:hypothetical protein
MHPDIRTSWISWITLFGYVMIVGLLWAAG